jgi:hypothetical protein
MRKKKKAQTEAEAARELLGGLSPAERPAEQQSNVAQAKPSEPEADQDMTSDQTPVEQPPATSEAEVVQAGANRSVASNQTTTEQPAAPPQATGPVPELPSSIESILDRPPLTGRIKDALALVDRVEGLRLCEQLGSPITEFTAAVTELVEAKVIKEDAINKTLHLRLTEEERREYEEDLATAKRDDRFQALARIHDHRTYRGDYPSWDEFLWHELGHTHDWWESEKRQVRIQQRMDERGLKLKVPLNKDMAQHLNRVRDDADLFVACVAEFQALPQDRQIAKRLGEIVERQLARKNKLASLRQSVPDATEEELSILAPIYATDRRWRCWYPEHTRDLHERVQTSGRPARDCLVELAQEIKAIPSDRVLLGVARGSDLVPVVNELVRMAGQWESERKTKEEIEQWERQGRRLGIYPLPSPDPTEPAEGESTPAVEPQEDEQEGEDAGPEDHDEHDEEAADLYDVDLTGDFRRLEGQEGFEALSSAKLANLLHDLAEAIEEGGGVRGPASLTVRPAVRQEQSA